MKDTFFFLRQGQKNNLSYLSTINLSFLPESKPLSTGGRGLLYATRPTVPGGREYPKSLFGSIQLDSRTKYYNQKRYYHISNIRSINRIGPHHEDVISVIIGSLLGDGYANKRSGEGIRICYRQSIIHKEYLF
jgi:hypothetical protein